MTQKPKYYVVWKGRKTGIFSSWEACAAQVQGFTGARYKSFPTRQAAEQALHGQGTPAPRARTAEAGRKWLIAPNPPRAASYCVDAACSGSPGPVEFRGVDLLTGKEVFRKGPYEHGTNNVGEFLAIVQALMILNDNHLPTARSSSGATPARPGARSITSRASTGAISSRASTGAISSRASTGATSSRAGAATATPIYSDSNTAIGWVRKKCCNTTLSADKKNAVLFELIDQAQAWLEEHTFSNPILKWDTQAWGENPADFNRK
jgi:ribonuclease HI